MCVHIFVIIFIYVNGTQKGKRVSPRIERLLVMIFRYFTSGFPMHRPFSNLFLWLLVWLNFIQGPSKRLYFPYIFRSYPQNKYSTKREKPAKCFISPLLSLFSQVPRQNKCTYFERVTKQGKWIQATTRKTSKAAASNKNETINTIKKTS